MGMEGNENVCMWENNGNGNNVWLAWEFEWKWD